MNGAVKIGELAWSRFDNNCIHVKIVYSQTTGDTANAVSPVFFLDENENRVQILRPPLAAAGENGVFFVYCQEENYNDLLDELAKQRDTDTCPIQIVPELEKPTGMQTGVVIELWHLDDISNDLHHLKTTLEQVDTLDLCNEFNGIPISSECTDVDTNSVSTYYQSYDLCPQLTLIDNASDTITVSVRNDQLIKLGTLAFAVPGVQTPSVLGEVRINAEIEIGNYDIFDEVEFKKHNAEFFKLDWIDTGPVSDNPRIKNTPTLSIIKLSQDEENTDLYNCEWKFIVPQNLEYNLCIQADRLNEHDICKTNLGELAFEIQCKQDDKTTEVEFKLEITDTEYPVYVANGVAGKGAASTENEARQRAIEHERKQRNVLAIDYGSYEISGAILKAIYDQDIADYKYTIQPVCFTSDSPSVLIRSNLYFCEWRKSDVDSYVGYYNPTSGIGSSRRFIMDFKPVTLEGKAGKITNPSTLRLGDLKDNFYKNDGTVEIENGTPYREDYSVAATSATIKSETELNVSYLMRAVYMNLFDSYTLNGDRLSDDESSSTTHAYYKITYPANAAQKAIERYIKTAKGLVSELNPSVSADDDNLEFDFRVPVVTEAHCVAELLFEYDRTINLKLINNAEECRSEQIYRNFVFDVGAGTFDVAVFDQFKLIQIINKDPKLAETVVYNASYAVPIAGNYIDDALESDINQLLIKIQNAAKSFSGKLEINKEELKSQIFKSKSEGCSERGGCHWMSISIPIPGLSREELFPDEENNAYSSPDSFEASVDKGNLVVEFNLNCNSAAPQTSSYLNFITNVLVPSTRIAAGPIGNEMQIRVLFAGRGLMFKPLQRAIIDGMSNIDISPTIDNGRASILSPTSQAEIEIEIVVKPISELMNEFATNRETFDDMSVFEYCRELKDSTKEKFDSVAMKSVVSLGACLHEKRNMTKSNFIRDDKCDREKTFAIIDATHDGERFTHLYEVWDLAQATEICPQYSIEPKGTLYCVRTIASLGMMDFGVIAGQDDDIMRPDGRNRTPADVTCHTANLLTRAGSHNPESGDVPIILSDIFDIIEEITNVKGEKWIFQIEQSEVENDCKYSKLKCESTKGTSIEVILG